MIGVDLSQWNGYSDFAKAKANGLKFAILRAVSTSKGIYIDNKFEWHYQQCKKYEIPVGVYLYTYAKSLAQLKNEIAVLDKAIKGKTFEFPIILDIEDPSINKSSYRNINTQNVKYFCDYYENKGYYAMFYSMPGFYGTSLNMSQLRNYDFWLAHWTYSTANKSKYIALNSNTGIWQYTDKGSFAGIAKAGGGLDVNISYKDYPSIMKQYGLNGFKKENTSQLDGHIASDKNDFKGDIDVKASETFVIACNKEYLRDIDVLIDSGQTINNGAYKNVVVLENKKSDVKPYAKCPYRVAVVKEAKEISSYCNYAIVATNKEDLEIQIVEFWNGSRRKFEASNYK